MDGIQPTLLDPRLATTLAQGPTNGPRSLAALGEGSVDLTASKAEQGRQALEAFQNILFSQMLKAMREATPKYEVLGSSQGEDIFQSFLDQEYVRDLGGQTGALGLTEALERQLGLETYKALEEKNLNKTEPVDNAETHTPPATVSRKEVSDPKEPAGL